MSSPNGLAASTTLGFCVVRLCSKLSRATTSLSLASCWETPDICCAIGLSRNSQMYASNMRSHTANIRILILSMLARLCSQIPAEKLAAHYQHCQYHYFLFLIEHKWCKSSSEINNPFRIIKCMFYLYVFVYATYIMYVDLYLLQSDVSTWHTQALDVVKVWKVSQCFTSKLEQHCKEDDNLIPQLHIAY